MLIRKFKPYIPWQTRRSWFAWYPVITEARELVWLETVTAWGQGHYDGVDWCYERLT